MKHMLLLCIFISIITHTPHSKPSDDATTLSNTESSSSDEFLDALDSTEQAAYLSDVDIARLTANACHSAHALALFKRQYNSFTDADVEVAQQTAAACRKQWFIKHSQKRPKSGWYNKDGIFQGIRGFEKSPDVCTFLSTQRHHEHAYQRSQAYHDQQRKDEQTTCIIS